MQEYFDIHSHILPGIDDGPKNLEETLRMLSIAYEEGIRIILATPHFLAGGSSWSVDKLYELYNEVSDAVIKTGIDINIILGNELFFSADLIDALDRGDALTIDSTRYILVEFSPGVSFRELWKGLNHCIFAGYIPILAHVERYRCLVRQPSFVGELISLGAYMQMNLSSVLGGITNVKVGFCHKLLKKEWVHFLGTDAHGISKRAPNTTESVEFLIKKFGEKRVRTLLWDNPMKMLENSHL